MSTGTRAYLDALQTWLPCVAPDLTIASVGRGEHFGIDEYVRLPLEIARLAPRLVHYLTPLAPAVRWTPYVVTVHDLIHLAFPALHGSGSRWYYATLGARVIRNARRILVGDERTVDDCVRFFGVSPERCSVVPLGFDPALLANTIAESHERPYLLYAGNHRAHKNLATLFAAWQALPPEVELDCYITGKDDLPENVLRYRTGGRLLVLGDVDRSRLWRLYRGALAYVHPAFAEGFGIPMLEAAASGTPVLASFECVPSILRSVARTFPARDVDALRDLLVHAVHHAEEERRRARELVTEISTYTWERFAGAVAVVYREVLSEMK
jgi:glycosyltransferase involved in cell wall biosynthesis